MARIKCTLSYSLTCHLLIRFLTKYKAGEIREDPTLAQQCYMTTLPEVRLSKTSPIKRLEAHDELIDQCGEPIKNLIAVPLRNGSED